MISLLNDDGRWPQKAGAILFFALVSLAFFWPVLFTNDYYLPIGSDFINFNYPNDLFAFRSLQAGEIPLWNPYVAAGQPYAADPNIGFFYPFRLLLTLTHFDYRAMVYLLVSHYFLAGLFTYALGREMGASRPGSLLAGIGFMFSGFLIGQMDHINIVLSSVWLPLVFLLFRRAVLRREVGYALAAGLALSLSILGGHQQFSLFIGYWCGLWLVVYLVQQRGRGWYPAGGFLVLVAIVALMGAAVQVGLTAQFFNYTQRAILTLQEADQHSMLPLGWLLLIFPNYLGQNSYQSPFFWDFIVHLNEFYPYAGLVVLFMAFLGSYVWKSPEKLFLVVMVGLAFLLTAGAVTPLFRLAYAIVPGMKLVRVPGRFGFWFNMAVPLLAAFGADWLWNELRLAPKRLWRDVWLLTVMGAMVGLAFYLLYPYLPFLQVPAGHPFQQLITNYRLTDALVLALIMGSLFLIVLWLRFQATARSAAIIFLLGLALIDFFRAQMPHHFTTNQLLAPFQFPVVDWLQDNQTGYYRMDYEDEISEKTFTDGVEGELGWRSLTNLVAGFYQVSGLPWNPFDLQTFTDYRKVIDFNDSFYDFLGVNYLVAGRDTPLSAKWIPQSVGTARYALYQNSQAMPRAFMVYESLIEPDPQQALALIAANRFDPAQTVLLNQGQPFHGPAGTSQVTITSLTNNTMSLEVESDRPGYLVVSDILYPGWQATVNGQPRPIEQANYAFRALFLEAGHSTVHFAYHSPIFVWGLAITGFTWIAILALLWARAKKKGYF